MTELKQHAENLWSLAQPLKMLGTQVGTRTTIARFSDGRLWIHSPGPDLPGVYASLRQLGEVAYVVAPNPFHHMFLPQTHKMFPDARLYGPARVLKKHPGLPIQRFQKTAPPEWAGEIETCVLEGLRLDERAFFHPQSQSLILTDLLFNMKGEDWRTRLMLKLEGADGKLACTRLVATLLLKDRQRLRQNCESILNWDFERLLMCHGEVLEENARSAFAKAMAWTGLKPPNSD